MGLDAHNATLQMIFTQPAQLQVARYQRHYEWTTTEIGQLLNDLLKGFHTHQENPAHEYFIGNFVFHNKSQNVIEIIDGQQRLTSFAIIFAALRDLVGNVDKASYINGFITNNNIMEKKAAQPRILLRRGDDAFFRNNIAKMRGTEVLSYSTPPEKQDSHHRIAQNAVYARQFISEHLTEETIPEFFAFITQRCRVILISVDNEEDALRIFETMNSRGRPLRPEDILRVDMVYYATEDNEERDALLEQWRLVELRVGGQSALPRFVEQMRLRRMNGAPAKGALHKEVIDSFASPEDAHLYYKNNLVDQSKLYHELIVNKRIEGIEDESLKRKINYVCRSLALIDDTEWVAVAMMFIEQHRAEPEILLERLKALDRLAWFYYLKHDDVNINSDRGNRFAKIIAALIASADSHDFDPSMSEFTLQNIEKDEMRRFVSERIDPKWKALKNLLVRIEYAFQPNKVLYNLMNESIEHILPVSPSADQTYWFNHFQNYDEITKNTELVGNLCLVPEEVNTLMADRSFMIKQRIMRKNRLYDRTTLSQGFHTADDWTPAVIAQRNQWIVEKFCEEFDIQVRELLPA